jgi:zinc/manganese transport system ATP-binding protein
LITINKLTVRYREHPALHHLSGRFARGSLTAVMGANGSGKSTLLNCIAGTLPLEAGRASGHVTVAQPQGRMAYLAQRHALERDFPITVHEAVLLGSWGQTGAWRGVAPALRARVAGALHAVGLQGLERRTLGSLSSGQFQRMRFARLLVQDAQLILLDEPFNALDAHTTADLLAVVAQWHQQGRTVVAVLHDEAQVRGHFPQTLLLARQLVAWGDTAQVLTASNLQRAHALAHAWDAPTGVRTVASPGPALHPHSVSPWPAT